MATDFSTTEEVEARLGAQFKALRLAEDIDQITLAKRANVGLTALKSLEAGKGSTLRTVVRVARALGRQDWIEDFYAEPEVSPMQIVRAQRGVRKPQRASARRLPAVPTPGDDRFGSRLGSAKQTPDRASGDQR
jgi:transcriptional regulator with XRE-family HTH domain